MPTLTEQLKKRLVKLNEACLYADMTRSMAYKLIRDGKITAYKHSSLVMIDLDTVDEYFNSLPRMQVRRRVPRKKEAVHDRR